MVSARVCKEICEFDGNKAGMPGNTRFSYPTSAIRGTVNGAGRTAGA